MAKKKDGRVKYDWVELTKKFVTGAFETVMEFQNWVKKRKELFPEEAPNLPSEDAIWKASKKFKWLELKKKRFDKMIDKVADGAIDKNLSKALQENIESKTVINKAVQRILIHFANNPGDIKMKGDLGDLVNDAKRGAGMVTKEQQQGMGYSAPGLVENDQDSFRKQLETSSADDIKAIEELNDKEMKELELAIPAEDLAFIEEEDDG